MKNKYVLWGSVIFCVIIVTIICVEFFISQKSNKEIVLVKDAENIFLERSYCYMCPSADCCITDEVYNSGKIITKDRDKIIERQISLDIVNSIISTIQKESLMYKSCKSKTLIMDSGTEYKFNLFGKEKIIHSPGCDEATKKIDNLIDGNTAQARWVLLFKNIFSFLF
ncbi:MAG TPA: hypothetical protein DDY52_00315 [Candidatus Moranbacteria bacterium]|nr:MAG: hypothetical protein UR51_C0004G0063 [Candidatus Moranbacteria bacterium GW2011_GWF1_34_10]HBI16592.1 hypothetical protein [Candidatus Moranbacteria bacterium]